MGIGILLPYKSRVDISMLRACRCRRGAGLHGAHTRSCARGGAVEERLALDAHGNVVGLAATRKTRLDWARASMGEPIDYKRSPGDSIGPDTGGAALCAG